MSHRRQRHFLTHRNGADQSFDSRTITGLSDGNAVSSWSDTSGNGRDVSQSTAGYKPTYKVNQVGGQPALSFDGGDTLLSASGWTDSVARTVLILFSASANGVVYSRGRSYIAEGGCYIYTSSNSTSWFNGTTAGFSNVDGSGKDRATSWGTGSTWRIVQHSCDGTTAGHIFGINGVLQSMTSPYPTYNHNPGTGSASLQTYIGSYDSPPGNAVTGYIAAFAVMPNASAPLRRRFEQAMAFSFKISCS